MLKYRSGSSGKEIDLSGGRIRAHIKTAGFYDYEYEVDETKVADDITVNGFTVDSRKYELVLDFRGNKEERAETAEELFAVTNIDIAQRKAGRLYLKDEYINCYIVSSKFENAGRDGVVRKIAGIYAAKPKWIKEYPNTFKASEVTSSNNKRYSGRYAYRYANGLNNTSVVNQHYGECSFLLRIHGPCVKPSVYIGGHEYHVDITLEAGEYLEIDSAGETVTKYMVSGIRVNAFHNRSFKNSVFQPVQTGRQDVFWDGKFDFDLILYEERSEPRWS